MQQGQLEPATRASGSKQPYMFEELQAADSLQEGSRSFDEAFDAKVGKREGRGRDRESARAREN